MEKMDPPSQCARKSSAAVTANGRHWILILSAVFVVICAVFSTIVWVGKPDDTVSLLPSALRARGVAALRESEPTARASLLSRLSRESGSGSSEFMIAVLETEPSAWVRQRIVLSLEDHSFPVVREALERRARSDPEPEVALAALSTLHRSASNTVVDILETRLRSSSDADEATERLQEAHDHWLTVARGAMLPSFLRAPPPVFEVQAADEPVRVAAFGDFGRGTPAQREVATAMARYHDEETLDLGITLGDNFYPRGMRSPADPRWKELWSDLYDRIGIRFYASLGNHDWGFADSPAAEVLFTRPDSSWQMPASRYSFRAGHAQFFALDTMALSAAQLAWLSRELERSEARWKIVYGHHPIRSAGSHGDTSEMVEKLLPVLADRADVYIAGHDHDMQQLATEAGVSLFVVGSGGADVRPIEPGPRSLFAASAHGFAVLHIEREHLTLDFLSTRLEVLHSARLTKP